MNLAEKQKEENEIADFEQNTDVKSAVRKLANPIADITAFNTIVQSVITSNPFGCVSYIELRRQPPNRRKDPRVLHGQVRVPGQRCKDHRQGSREL